MSTEGEKRREQIDRYVNGAMEGPELHEFEQRMREHVELAESVHLHRDVLEGVQYHFMQGLKEELIQSDQLKPKSRLTLYLSVAASVLLAAGLGIAYYVYQAGSQPEALYAAYYQPYPNIIAPVTRSSQNSLYADAMQLYEAGRYAEVIPALSAHMKAAPDNDTLTLYRGIAYLSSEQPQAAMEDFRQVIQSEEEALLGPAYWYLGLSQLKTGQVAAARATFRQLVQQQGALAGKAQEILSKLPS